VKKMFASEPAAGLDARPLLDSAAKAEFNKRAGQFVHAEARASAASQVPRPVVKIARRGARIEGQYYVVAAEHIFYTDTATPPSSAPSIHHQKASCGENCQGAQQMQAAAQKKEVAKDQAGRHVGLKAAREAQEGDQAVESAKGALDRPRAAGPVKRRRPMSAQARGERAEVGRTAPSSGLGPASRRGPRPRRKSAYADVAKKRWRGADGGGQRLAIASPPSGRARRAARSSRRRGPANTQAAGRSALRRGAGLKSQLMMAAESAPDRKAGLTLAQGVVKAKTR